MPKKPNGTLKIVSIVFGMVFAIATVLWASSGWHKEVDITVKEAVSDIELLTKAVAQHEERMDACDVFKATVGGDIKHMMEDQAAQKIERKDERLEQRAFQRKVFEQFKELRK